MRTAVSSSPRRARRSGFVARTTLWIPAGVIGLLMAPMATTSRTFGDDWTKHLWMVRQQQLNIEANGRPGLFLSAHPLGVFYPIFAFVGSGLYTVGGYLAIVLGDRPIIAYKLLYLAALCLAYAGATWLATQVGLRGWRSQMPGLVFVTGTYFVTDMFGRGDLGELMALAAIPFLIAAVTAVAVSDRLRPGPVLAVVLAVFVLTGSHNITLLYGTIFLALLALVLLGAFSPATLRRLPWRRLPAVIAASAIGAGLNAWYLVADLKYGLDTNVADYDRGLKVSFAFTGWRLLLDPLRTSDPSITAYAHDMRVALPCLFLAWAAVVAVVAWRRIDGVGRRLIGLLGALAALYIFLLVTPAPWNAFPRFLNNIQYAWRLHAYVLLATALLVMVVLVWERREAEPMRRAASAALAAIALFTVGTATWQAWVVPSTYYHQTRERRAPHDLADIVVASSSVRPPSWSAGDDFAVLNRPVIDIGFAHTLRVPEADVVGSTYAGWLTPRAGSSPFRTNIAAGSELVRITGIQPIGFTASGMVVARRVPGTAQTGPVYVTIHEAPTGLLRTGALISLVSLVALGLLLLWPIGAWLRPRFRA